jgi:hypothetical protein
MTGHPWHICSIPAGWAVAESIGGKRSHGGKENTKTTSKGAEPLRPNMKKMDTMPLTCSSTDTLVAGRTHTFTNHLHPTTYASACAFLFGQELPLAINATTHIYMTPLVLDTLPHPPTTCLQHPMPLHLPVACLFCSVWHWQAMTH